MNNAEIIQLDGSNIHYLYALYEAVYSKKAAPGYFHKKYNTAHLGVQYLGCIALHNAQPVAYYGVIPYRVSISGEPVIAAQSCDTMTHPAHRNKGFFTQLALLTFELAEKKGIPFVFGFPNQNSYPGFIKHLGFAHAHTMNRYTVDFNDTLYKKVYRKLFPHRDTSRAEITNSLVNEGHDGLIYDADLIQYKSYNSNFIRSDLDHMYTAWLKQQGGTWLGAIHPASQKTLDALLNDLEKKQKASSVTVMVSPATQLDGLLAEMFSPQPGFAVITKNLTGRYTLDKLKFQFADLDIF